jgi:hypothetical protein
MKWVHIRTSFIIILSFEKNINVNVPFDLRKIKPESMESSFFLREQSRVCYDVHKELAKKGVLNIGGGGGHGGDGSHR